MLSIIYKYKNVKTVQKNKKIKEIPSEPVIEEEAPPESVTPRPEGATEEEGDGDGGEDGAGN